MIGGELAVREETTKPIRKRLGVATMNMQKDKK